jgi:hypothetical protein
MDETVASRPPTEMPDTHDPIVLRELLRQAREQLQMRESIEQMMAASMARTEAVLLEARGAGHAAGAIDAEGLRDTLATLRGALREALAAADDLESKLPPSPARMTDGHPVPTDEPAGPRTVEVLVQRVTSPKVARSLQHYLADLDQVTRAEVRELAEGLLRITVKTSAPLTGDTIAGWEPERERKILTQRADVLEVELAG